MQHHSDVHRWIRIGAAVVALLIAPVLAVPATAATDPDIDPAMPVELTLAQELDSLEITEAALYLQESKEGLRYLRIDYEIANVGDTTSTGHSFRLSVQGVETTVAAGDILEPGASVKRSYLLFGEDIDGVEPGSGDAVLDLHSATLGGTSRNCQLASTREQCDAVAASTQALCNGRQIGRGCDSGTVVCTQSCFTDSSGEFCCSWDPLCVCNGRPAELTLIEAIAEGLVPSDDPLIYPGAAEEHRLEVRPHHPGDP
jgi:hypothetical protein